MRIIELLLKLDQFTASFCSILENGSATSECFSPIIFLLVRAISHVLPSLLDWYSPAKQRTNQDTSQILCSTPVSQSAQCVKNNSSKCRTALLHAFSPNLVKSVPQFVETGNSASGIMMAGDETTHTSAGA